MNIVFFGSHQYSLYTLEALFKAGYKICGVVTQPDRPAGRQQVLTPTPVKTWAISHKIPILTPENKEELFTQVNGSFSCHCEDPDLVGGRSNPQRDCHASFHSARNDKIDLAIVCVYGLIIPEEVLKLPKYGFINIHPSLLPKYRGTAPVQAAIIMAEKETGVTIIKMDERLDHGPIIAQEKEKIRDDDTVEILYHRLFKKGADLLIKVLPQIPQIPQIPQEGLKSSYTRRLKRDDGFIPWEFIKAALSGKHLNQRIQINFLTMKKEPFQLPASSFQLHRFILGLSPWPGAWSEVRSQKSGVRRLKLLRSHLDDGRLILDEVQIEGEKPTSFKNLQSLILENA